MEVQNCPVTWGRDLFSLDGETAWPDSACGWWSRRVIETMAAFGYLVSVSALSLQPSPAFALWLYVW